MGCSIAMRGPSEANPAKKLGADTVRNRIDHFCRPCSLSLIDLSPTALVRKGIVFVAFRSYFDGGNQADISQYHTVTLAAITGTHIQIVNFEDRWNANFTQAPRAIRSHNRPTYAE
jgi:hypothetical protein